MHHRCLWTALLGALLLFIPLAGGRVEAQAAESATDKPEEQGVKVHYGPHGLEVNSNDGRFRAWFGLRAQLRFSYPFDNDPLTPEDFAAVDQANFDIRRARFKSGGHIYREWLEYDFEYELRNARLLSLEFTIERYSGAQLSLGQWKAEYNRERRDSSGELQFADRSIVNRAFTIDRQPGVMVMGHLWRDRRADSRYFTGVFAGEGALNFENEGHPLWLARWQWNFLGRDLPFTQSDVERLPKPAASVAVARLWNRSRYTRFSQAGGGELEGFPADVAERYDMRQALAEFAYRHRGLSLQAEYHWKTIEDRVEPRETRMRGAYGQVGYFFDGLWPSFPSALELAARAAFVDPDTSRPDDRQTELTFGANWFFAGHRNKLTLDSSRIGLESADGDEAAWRVRLQWDVSF
jgi:phosphate-selective porin